jgi:hypothetical protein
VREVRQAGRKRAFFFVRPEEAGRPEREPAEPAPTCIFDSWLGDDIVAAHPVLLATTRLKRALEQSPAAGCLTTSRASTRRSRFFLRHNPGRRLPTFWVLDVVGTPGVDEMGMTPDHSLVVSQNLLDVLVQFRIPRAVISQYSAGSRRRE